MAHSRLEGAKTGLEVAVQEWANEEAEDYPDSGVEGVLEDLMQGGCASGMVGALVYYTDTVKFYREHRESIAVLLAEMLDSCGCSIAELFGDKWDAADPLANGDLNQNLLACFGFEEAARSLAQRNGIEV